MKTRKILARKLLFSSTLILGLLGVGISSVWAQNVGENTLIIRSGFTPQINDAKKIDHQPKIQDTIYKAPKFEYQIQSQRIFTPFSPRPLKAAKMQGEPLDKLYNAYIAAGIGNLATPYFQFDYSNGRSRNERYGLSMQHLSSAGKIDHYLYPGFSDNKASIFYTKIFKKNRFDFDLNYLRTVRHFYGINTEDSVQYPTDLLTDKANLHLYNFASANMNLERYRHRRNEVNYKLALGYYFLQDNYSSMENGAKLQGFIDWGKELIPNVKDQRFGLALGLDYYNNIDSLKKNNAFILGITPYYNFKLDRLSVQLGIKADVSQDSLSEIFFFPDIKLNFNAIDDVLTFKFAMNGKATKTNMKSIYEENPFTISTLPMQISKNNFNADFGLNSSFSRYINLSLGLRYEKWENAPLFILDTTLALPNRFTLIYDNFDIVNLNAQLSFHLNTKLNILLGGQYFVYNTLKELYAWNRPDYIFDLTANYKIGDKLMFYGKVVHHGPSHSPLYQNGVVSSQTLKSWTDISLGIEYRYRKKIGAFVKFNNILASKYYQWYNYPSYGFNFMAGLSYLF